MKVIENDLVEGRNALNRTCREIHQAAKYCSNNYPKATANGQRRVIDETMKYATQSLGTMIQHLSHLANAFLSLLDERTEKMSEVEEKVAQLTMEVKIRREKVARKAIGSCTISKEPVRCTLTKLRQEPPAEYVRRPIDYSLLDHIGHGVKTQESVSSPYGAPTAHAQTLTRRGSTSTHQIGMHGNTINPKSMNSKFGSEYAATSVSGPECYQSGTLGRTAGIYRTGMMGQYGNPYGGQQHQVLVSVGRNPPATSAGYVSTTGSLGGPSRRSSSSSGNQHRASGYTPSGIHLAQTQHQAVPNPTGCANKQQLFGDQRSPTQEKTPPSQPPSQLFTRQHSAPGGVPMGSVQHHFPGQYQPQAVAQLHSDAKNTNTHDLPSTEVAASARPQMLNAMMPTTQLDNSMSISPTGANLAAHVQQQYNQSSNSASVDISRLQPGPMDHLRPRQHNDPAWAPHQYIQKVVTVYEYTADKGDELTFGENELIYVIKKNDDGWWEGVMMNGQTGLFPGNYVEVIE